MVKWQNKVRDGEPNILVSPSLQVSRYITLILLQSSLKFMWHLFPDTALWNSLLRYKTYYISQLMLSHLYIAFSSTLEPSIFSFDLTKWSFSVFTLQIANRMGHGNSALYLGERIVALCAFCNILWTLFNARWNVKTRLKLSFLCCFSRSLNRFSLFIEWTFWISLWTIYFF